MLKAIVFDLDHTLYDRYATLEKTLPYTWERVRGDLNDWVTYDKFKELIIESDKKYNYDGWEKRTEFLKEQGIFNKEVDPRAFRLTTYEGLMKVAVHYDFTIPLLKELKSRGYLLGIITNGEDYIQKAKVKLLNFSEYFDVIYYCGDKNIQKPRPEPFLEAAEILGVSPSECVYVGDNPKHDIMGARNVGYKTVWVATTGPWRYYDYERADFEVENVSQLLEILPQIEESMK